MATEAEVTEMTRNRPAEPILIGAEIEDALAAGRAVVALESTIICHGLPPGRNLEVARACEKTVRDQGAVPATIAILDGRIRIGLDGAGLERLAAAQGVDKCSTRDIARVVVAGGDGATTVAGTIALAARAGIRVMATGGIGGVHRGGEASLDISADLIELGVTPVAVVAAGAKIILDLARTLELLETHGVPVVGYRCDELPGFYVEKTGLAVPWVDHIETLARQFALHRRLFRSGMVVCRKPTLAMAPGEVSALVEAAERAAGAKGVSGAASTPFLLAHMAEASRGRTVDVNAALVVGNAELAGRLARALSDLETNSTHD